MRKPKYTLEDFEKAKVELRSWVDRFDRYSGNNPNKYQSDIKAARRHVRVVEETLKATGLVQLSDTDFIEKKFDVAVPNAAGKQRWNLKGDDFSGDSGRLKRVVLGSRSGSGAKAGLRSRFKTDRPLAAIHSLSRLCRSAFPKADIGTGAPHLNRPRLVLRT